MECWNETSEYYMHLYKNIKLDANHIHNKNNMTKVHESLHRISKNNWLFKIRFEDYIKSIMQRLITQFGMKKKNLEKKRRQ